MADLEEPIGLIAKKQKLLKQGKSFSDANMQTQLVTLSIRPLDMPLRWSRDQPKGSSRRDE